jgi:hypothetical protein
LVLRLGVYYRDKVVGVFGAFSCAHMDGRKAELGHVLLKLFVINLRHVVP